LAPALAQQDERSPGDQHGDQPTDDDVTRHRPTRSGQHGALRHNGELDVADRIPGVGHDDLCAGDLRLEITGSSTIVTVQVPGFSSMLNDPSSAVLMVVSHPPEAKLTRASLMPGSPSSRMPFAFVSA
jgi:hypothetical protein